MKTVIKVFLFIIYILHFNAECNASIETRDTLKVLFIGNSYTYMNNLPQIVSIISDKCNTKLITEKSASGGATLKDHWLGNKGLETKEKIEKGVYDIVIMQGQSTEPINARDSLQKYSILFCDFIKRNGAKPYLFATWPRKKIPQNQEIIEYTYESIAKKTSAGLIPIGASWEMAKKVRPDVELYGFDGSHPSELGTFLTANVIVSYILNELPSNLESPYTIKDIYGQSVLLMYIDPLDVVFCEGIVKKLYKQTTDEFEKSR